ncbi:hypothetical protein PHJA_000879200 [Phtheirospermum japonicum]|uniref:Glycosyl transferase CAP10 domain-containing protein n=1 Tax=Phtheirospermum japonicum TaxID=374723 RepID=A0A830BUS8_9LAMI|nr:hypothetical protein PHJA_000879200 [Phtheirospermum japonicum]
MGRERRMPTGRATRMSALMKCNATAHNDWNARLYVQDWVAESPKGYKGSSLGDQCTHSDLYEGMEYPLQYVTLFKQFLRRTSCGRGGKDGSFMRFRRASLRIERRWEYRQTEKRDCH